MRVSPSVSAGTSSIDTSSAGAGADASTSFFRGAIVNLFEGVLS